MKSTKLLLTSTLALTILATNPGMTALAAQSKNPNDITTATNPNNSVNSKHQNGKRGIGTSANNSQSTIDTTIRGEYYNDYGFSHFTRYNLEHMQDHNTNVIANLNGATIDDLKSAIDDRGDVQGQQLNVWDSWPLQDNNGRVVDYHGYHITFALVGNPNKDYTTSTGHVVQDTRIFVFDQKVGTEAQGVNSWKCAGPLFSVPTEGVPKNDPQLNNQKAQWSGSTVVDIQGNMRIFYTSYNGTHDDDWQSINTAQLKLKASHDGITVDHNGTKNNHTIMIPDGKYYQKVSQSKNDAYDENMFRDPHYFVYNSKPYITFAASAGPKDGPEGENVINNQAYLGGDVNFRTNQHQLLDPTTNNPWHTPATEYNAVFGVAELDPHTYNVKKVMKPILGFNTVSDEIERPDLFEHNGKWYVFGITRGYKLATPNVKASDSFMMGFVADSPFGPYKPLNGNGLVIHNSQPWSSRQYTYSHYVLNNNSKDNNLLVTSYATNSKQQVGHQTFAPTMVLHLNGDKATVDTNKVLAQGTTEIGNNNMATKAKDKTKTKSNGKSHKYSYKTMVDKLANKLKHQNK